MRLIRKLEKLHDRLPGLRFYGCLFLVLGVGIHGILCNWDLPGGSEASQQSAGDRRLIPANRIMGLGSGDRLIFAIHADSRLFGHQIAGDDSDSSPPGYTIVNEHYDVSSAAWCGVILPAMLILVGAAMLSVAFFGTPAKWTRSNSRRRRPIIRPGPPNAPQQ